MGPLDGRGVSARLRAGRPRIAAVDKTFPRAQRAADLEAEGRWLVAC